MHPPYSGYTWHFTQHAVAWDPRNLYALLKVAALFRGQRGKSADISSMLSGQEILTKNVRKDSMRPDAWRDYQQVLAELGLMVSTDVLKEITLTPVGLLLLDGSLGFSETLTNQALRYQYPNGFKWAISPTVRKALGTSGVGFSNLAELQSANQVLIKPGILILRFLLQLVSDRKRPYISPEECQGFILPVGRHQDWHRGYEELLAHRKNGKPFPRYGVKRNVQDWFKLLERTDIFCSDVRGNITLREWDNLADLERICQQGEDAAAFWYPSAFSDAARISWFYYFGKYDVNTQWAVFEPSEEYVEQNYVEGSEPEEMDTNVVFAASMEILLRKFDEEWEKAQSKRPAPYKPIPFDFSRMIAKAQEKTNLHQLVLLELAKVLKVKGFNVFPSKGGPDESVDLVAERDARAALFEVKTITKKNWRQRVRLGVGQLSEYRYRFERQKGQRPGAILVISSETSLDAWLKDFFERDVKVGLMGYGVDRFVAYTNTSIERDIGGSLVA